MKSNVQDLKSYVMSENIAWAGSASYKQFNPVLHYTIYDPKGVRNIAFNGNYKHLAQTMKKKLIDIVIRNNGLEEDWGKLNDKIFEK